MKTRQMRVLELIARLPRLDRLVTRYLQPVDRTTTEPDEPNETLRKVSDSE